MTSADIEEQLLREQVRLTFRQAPTGTRGNMLVTVVCAGIVWSADLPWFSLLPFAAVASVYALRWWQLAQFQAGEERRPPRAWRSALVRPLAAAGVAWASMGALTLPFAPVELQVFLLIITCGLTAAALATLAPVRAAYLAYMVPFIAGIAISIAFIFPRYPLPMAALLFFYGAVMARASGEQAEAVGRSLRLSLENQALVAELVAVNARSEEARRRAEAASLAKSQFLARMSHEIRTPMNGILGVHELLLTSPLGPDERRFVETAHQSGQALLSIISDVLDFSKIEAGKVTLETAPFKTERLLEELMALFAIASHRKGLQLSYELDEAVPAHLVGDELRLRQVLTNLLGNAIKFTAKGEVALSVLAVPEGRVRLGVRDTGIGIDDAHRTRVFESFEQVDTSISRRFGGTGLGLAISRQLVTLMGGSLEVRSEPGEGSEFFFTVALPAAGGAAMEERLAVGEGRRAVVRVQHARSRQNLERWLKAEGFVIDAAGGPVEAAALVVVDDSSRAAVEGLGVPTLLCEQALSLSAPGPEHARVAQIALPLQRSAVLAAAAQVLKIDTPLPLARTLGSFGTARVLVVDDDAINRTITQAMLGRLGCKPVVVPSGRAALEAMAGERFDLVLMDCEMPDLDGLSATREIRRLEKEQAGRRVPVVALTAHATEAQRALCLEADMDEMVTKPLSLAELEKCLGRWTT